MHVDRARLVAQQPRVRIVHLVDVERALAACVLAICVQEAEALCAAKSDTESKKRGRQILRMSEGDIDMRRSVRINVG